MNVFDKAIVEIKARGWGQTELMDQNGQVCILGACALGAGYPEANLDEAVDAYEDERFVPMLNKVINEDFGVKVTRPYQFNDGLRGPVTVDDIIAVLEKASVRENEKI